ncbi:MAG TPA: WD40 repeat domain-containing protein, partial [Planctomycetaceae bacterium]|nr:WD40 repeat domain-containing protein [Planctomycetaceae bacterium]
MRYLFRGVLCLYLCTSRLLIAQSPIHHFEGHTAAVYSANYSPSGRYLVSTGFDETVRVWDAASRSPITTFRGHSGIVLSAVFSPDDSMIASSGLDRTIRLWDVPKSKPMKSEQTFPAKLTASAFVPTGERLVVGDERNKLLLWNVKENTPLGEIDGPSVKPSRILLRPDGNALVVSDNTGFVTAYTASPFEKQSEWRAHLGKILGAAYTPNGSYLITVGEDGLLRRWTASPGIFKAFESSSAKIENAQLSAAGNLLATADADGQIRLWDVNQGKPIQSIHQQANYVTLSANQQKLVAVGNDKIVRLFQTGDGKLLKEFPVLPEEVTSIGIRPDERQLAVGLASGKILILDSNEGTTLHTLVAPAKPSVAWDSDNKHVCSASEEGVVKRWNSESGSETASFDCGSALSALAFDPRKMQLAIGQNNGIVRILSSEKLEPLSDWTAHGTEVTQLSFSADGAQLISGSSRGVTTLWDVEQKVPLQHFGRDENEFSSVAIHPDKTVILVERSGRIVRVPQAVQLAVRLPNEKPLAFAVSRNSNECAVAFESGVIRTYTIANGQEAKQYEQTGKATALNYSPNNSYLAAGDPAGIVTLWRLSNQRREGLILTPRPVVSLEFSHDSNKLLVSGDDRKIRIY